MDGDVGGAGVRRERKVDVFGKKKVGYPQLWSQKIGDNP